TLELLVLADREPELHQHDAVQDQHLLEIVDLRIRAHPVGLGGEALDALHEHAPIPRAVEQLDATASGYMAPEPPQVRLGALLFARRGGGERVIDARIERAGHAPDRAALAGGVEALEHRDRRQGAERAFARQRVEPALPAVKLRLVRGFRYRLIE